MFQEKEELAVSAKGGIGRICADAGTENCPCLLAEYGSCIVCSRLHGRSGCCGCIWQGSCIYSEYLQNNCCINELRKYAVYEIKSITAYAEDLAVMRIAVPRGIAEKAALPGSFVFLKRPGSDERFAVPLSVMKTSFENCFIEVAVRLAGPKTAELIKSTDSVEMRGIYRNGLLGGRKLLSDVPKRVLCITKGVGLAPAANYAQWASGRDTVDFIIDTEKINMQFAEYCLQGCAVDSVTYSRLPARLTWNEHDKYEIIMLSASDYYQENMYIPQAKKVLSNNCAMCCGEGICGACVRTESDGKMRRMCKDAGV